MIPWLEADDPFPDVCTALTEKDGACGLLAAGADLSMTRLLAAYRQGIFPWFSGGEPILWWCTDPRMVLFVERFHISSSLYKTLKKVECSRQHDKTWDIRFDHAFKDVMKACAAPCEGRESTWISDQIITAYTHLYQAGFAHSIEVWHDDVLVGGAYGVSIGRMFYGESMFSRTRDASKIALAYLVAFLKSNGVVMIDCQQETAHLTSLGATSIPRQEFILHLQQATKAPSITIWQPIGPI